MTVDLTGSELVNRSLAGDLDAADQWNRSTFLYFTSNRFMHNSKDRNSLSAAHLTPRYSQHCVGRGRVRPVSAPAIWSFEGASLVVVSP